MLNKAGWEGFGFAAQVRKKEEAHPKIMGSCAIADDGPRGFSSSSISIFHGLWKVKCFLLHFKKEANAIDTKNPSPGLDRQNAFASNI
jgi:hypothetical protein